MFTFPKHHFDPGFIFAGFVSLRCIFIVYFVDTVTKTAVQHSRESSSHSQQPLDQRMVGGRSLQTFNF